MNIPYLVDKPLGATPLEALALVRAARPEVTEAKLSYAGRLDPMATGLIAVLHGKLLARQEEFWHLPKIYNASVLLGMVTDSYDLLGLATPVIATDRMLSHERILAVAARLVGKHRLAVPMFSSHRVAGRPLFAWVREGRTDLPAPVRTMTITEVAIHDIERISVPDLHDRIRRSVSLVRGDFRQDDILAGWKEVLHNREDDELQVVRMTVHCNAGTYLRSLADVMGRSLGTGGTLLELRRTHVGRWHVGASDVIRSGHLNN